MQATHRKYLAGLLTALAAILTRQWLEGNWALSLFLGAIGSATGVATWRVFESILDGYLNPHCCQFPVTGFICRYMLLLVVILGICLPIAGILATWAEETAPTPSDAGFAKMFYLIVLLFDVGYALIASLVTQLVYLMLKTRDTEKEE